MSAGVSAYGDSPATPEAVEPASTLNPLSRARPMVIRSAPSIRSKATSWSPESTTAQVIATPSVRASDCAAAMTARAAASVSPAACDAVGPRDASTLSRGKASTGGAR